MNSAVYMDHNATSPLSDEVKEWIRNHLEDWGNPSSVHATGRGPKTILREARQSLSKMLGCNPLEIIFTSGGSESNNTVFQAVVPLVHKDQPARNEIIISSVEHPSLLQAAETMESRGYTVHRLKVDRSGRLDMDHYKSVLSTNTVLVSVMLANNEVGSLFPIREVAEKARAVGALVHTDAVQALGKVPLDLPALGVDYASFSAHKFYALKGCGALYVRTGAPFDNLIFGGGQERGRRAGTENVLAIGTFGVMTAHYQEIETRMTHMKRLREKFEKSVLTQLDNVTVIGSDHPRLPNTSSVILKGVDGESLLMGLDLAGFAVSTGSACSSGSAEPSPVLLAMGYQPEEAESTLRVSVGWFTTEEHVERFTKALIDLTRKLRLRKGGVSNA